MRLAHSIRLLLVTAFLGGVQLYAQESSPAENAASFNKKSLALRSALHYDPSLATPLKELIKLYTQVSRSEELIGLYRSHLNQYPSDAGARSTYLNLLRLLAHPDAATESAAATQLHPNSPLIARARYEVMKAQGSSGALDELTRAISLSTLPGQKRAWIEELAAEAPAAGRTDLAESHLRELAKTPDLLPTAKVDLARTMLENGFADLAIETLSVPLANNTLDPEARIEAELLAARAESQAGQRAAAGERLDRVLGTVAADYWRRGEIVALRVNLIDSDKDRADRLQAARTAYEENPKSEAAALDLAELLEATERRSEALEILLAASAALPKSDRIERAALDLAERLGDEFKTVEFLAARLQIQPKRADLRYRYLKTLYATGDREQASAELETLLQQLDPGARTDRLLELARHLRRASLASDAVPLFEQVVEETPERLDVRRELAETLIAIGKKDTARALFAEELSGEAEVENFLDLTQFLLSQGFLPEARQAVDRRIESEGESFDLLILIAAIDGRQGEIASGEKHLLSARALADTSVRYREWLSAATRFYEGDEVGLQGLFANEETLLSEEDREQKQPRLLALIEMAQTAGEPELAERLLRQEIGLVGAAGGAPLIVMQKLLLDTIEADTERANEALSLLSELAAAEPETASLYELRAALIHHRLGRSDLVGNALRRLDPADISDPSILTSVRPLFGEYQLEDKALACCLQLTRLEPNDLAHWEKLVTHLAAGEKEDRLRYTLRSLLSGGDARPLSDISLEAIRNHLAASTWRSIATQLHGEAPPDPVIVLPLIDDLERASPSHQTRMWLAWARVRTLQLLGKEAEATDALTQLDTLLEQAPAREKLEGEQGEEDLTPSTLQLAFPDGLAASPTAARRALFATAQPDTAKAGIKGDGPLGKMELAWGFATTHGAAITRLAHHANSGSLLIMDTLGSLLALDENSGKIRWSHAPSRDPRGISALYTGSVAPSSQPSFFSRSHSRHASQERSNRHPDGFALGDSNLLFTSGLGSIRCVDVTNGKTLWESPLAQELTQFQDPYGQGERTKAGGNAILTLTPDRLLAFDPGTASAMAFDPNSGKRLWVRDFGGGMPSNATVNGASYSAGHFLVYSIETHILDAETGETLWGFSDKDTPAFPLDLNTPQSSANASSGLFAPAGMANRQNVVAHQSLPYNTGNSPQMFLQRIQNSGSVRLVNPMTHWQQQTRQGTSIFAHLTAGRILFDNGGSLLISHLNLPLGGQTSYSHAGTLCGESNGRLLYVDHGSATTFMLATGQRHPLDVSDLLGEADAANLMQGVVEGTRAYISGPRGTASFNLRSGELLDLHLYSEATRKFLGPIRKAQDNTTFMPNGITNLAEEVLPPRLAVSADKLFVLGTQNQILALRKKDK